VRLLAAAFLLALPLVNAFAQDISVVEDFEDVGTWRARPGSGVPPEGWFSGNLFLAASDREKRNGQWVGELRYLFAGDKGPYRLSLEREKASRTSAFIKAIVFDANGKGSDCSISFEIEDAVHAKFNTALVPLNGTGWQIYRCEINDKTIPDFSKIKFPAVLRRIILSKNTPGAGSIFLDDLRLEGRVSAANTLVIRPIYGGLAHVPGVPVKLNYRVRSASDSAQSVEVLLKVSDVRGGAVKEYRQTFSVPATGETMISFDVGVLPVGSYAGQLSLSAGDLRSAYLDFFGVFVPNNAQPNTSPMWFGVQDLTTWHGEAENALHIEWMKQLGIDIARVGIVGPFLHPSRGPLINEPLAKMLRDIGKSGIKVNLLYTDAVPEWTQKTVKWRTPPTDWAGFEDHARQVGQFLSGFSNVKYFEFWNEADLDFFQGSLADYLAMLKSFGSGFRPAAPGIKLSCAGLTVKHPAEKPGFSKGVIQHPELFDVAAFHSHGSASDYALRFDMVDQWLAETGEKRPIANTESGYRSGYDLPGAVTQAIVLTQKITEARSHPNTEFFIWFTLKDYWDMDRDADDSLGLVTSDNRPKPSFVAYNELIRRLANTEPVGRVALSPDLSAYAFRKSDGTRVYVCWPENGHKIARTWVKSVGRYTAVDMFGQESDLGAGGSPAMLSVELPVYLQSSQPNDELQSVTGKESFFEVPETVMAGKNSAIPIRLSNIWKEPVDFTVSVKDEGGQEIGKQSFSVKSGEQMVENIALSCPESPSFQASSAKVHVTVSGDSPQEVSVPFEIRSPYPVNNSLDSAPIITLNKSQDVVELAYDPFHPAWRGPDDLSVAARFAHDNEALLLRFDVTDATHNQNEKESEMWKGDSVQLAVQSPDGHLTELTFGLRSVGGSTVWCSTSDRPEKKGIWKIPFTAKREGRKTIYEARVPLADLGLAFEGKPVPFRLAFVLNNNDGDGRVRFMHWFGGIASHINPEEFGFAILK